MSLFFRKGNAVGVSISDGSIEIVECSPAAGGAFAARAFARRQLPSGILSSGRVQDIDLLSAALREAFDRGAPVPFSLSSIDIALPDDATYFHVFTFPGSLSDAEIAKALPFQSEEIIPFASEDLIGDFRVASRTAEQTVVMYAVALRDVVRDYSEAARRAGLKVNHLYLEADALASALLVPVPESTASVVIDAGAKSTVVFVRDQGGLRASFSIPVAGDQFTAAIVKAAKLTPEKAEALKRKIGLLSTGDAAARKALRGEANDLFARIGKVFRWYETLPEHGAISEVTVTGGTSEMPGFVQALTDSIRAGRPEMKIVKGNTFLHAGDSALIQQVVRKGGASMFAPAVGAAALSLFGVRPFDFSNPSKSSSGLFNVSAPSRKSQPPELVSLQPASAEDARPSLRERFASIGGGGKERVRLIAAVCFLLIAVGGLGYAAYHRAQVQKGIDEEIAASRAELEARMNEETVETFVQPFVLATDPAEGQVVARHLVIPAPAASTSPPAGSEAEFFSDVDVELINDSDAAITLIPRTRLQSAEGPLYRLVASVAVPAHGRASATARADIAGADQSVGPTTFTLPGLPPDQQVLIRAVSAGPSIAFEEGPVGGPGPDEALTALLQPGEIILEGLIRTSPDGSVEALAVLASALLEYAERSLQARSGLSLEELDRRGEVKYDLLTVTAPYDGGETADMSFSIGVYPHEASPPAGE